MKKSVFKVLGIFVVIALVALIVDYAFGVRTYHDVATYAIGGGASAIVSDPVTTVVEDADAPDIQLNDIDQEIVKIDPSRFPLNTCLREVSRTRKVESQITEFYSRDYKPLSDTVTTAVTAAAQTYFYIIVDNIDMWSLHDNVMIDGVAAYNSDNTVNPLASLVGFIAKLEKSASKIYVQPTNGYVVGGVCTLKVGSNIAQGGKLIRLARAEDELAMQTVPYALFPTSETNYCQNYMAQIEQSEFDRLTKKKINWGFGDFTEANIKDMKAQKELSFFFGAKSEIIDKETGSRIYTCGGATQFLTKSLAWSDADFLLTASDAWFVALTKKVFQGNSGSQIRYAFFGPDLMEKINSIPNVVKQITAENTEVKWGLTFNQIVSTFGILKIIKSDLLGEIGYGDRGFIFDMAKVEEHKFIAMTEKELDLKLGGTRNSNATVLQEVSCPVFKYPDTHLYIHKA